MSRSGTSDSPRRRAADPDADRPRRRSAWVPLVDGVMRRRPARIGDGPLPDPDPPLAAQDRLALIPDGVLIAIDEAIESGAMSERVGAALLQTDIVSARAIRQSVRPTGPEPAGMLTIRRVVEHHSGLALDSESDRETLIYALAGALGIS